MIREDKVVNIVRQQIKAAPEGTLFFNNSFPEFDDEYIGKVLKNAVKDGLLLHLSRGIYLKAALTRFGPVYPSIEETARAIAARDNAEVLPTGATVLNLLGLSTQVPMNAVFITSGSARKIPLGGRTITFKRAVPRNFSIRGRWRSLIVQALKAIGEQGMTPQYAGTIQALIFEHPEPDTYEQDLAVMPTWIRRFFQKTNQNANYETLA